MKTILSLCFLTTMSSVAFAEMGGFSEKNCNEYEVQAAESILKTRTLFYDNGARNIESVIEAQIFVLDMKVCAEDITTSQYFEQKVSLLEKLTENATLYYNSGAVSESVKTKSEKRLQEFKNTCKENL